LESKDPVLIYFETGRSKKQLLRLLPNASLEEMIGFQANSNPPIPSIRFPRDAEVGLLHLELYASTTDTDLYWIISLLEIDPEGNERLLTKGWLRGSHRELGMQKSKPWEPIHSHTKSEDLTPGQIYKFNISLVPTSNLFKADSRMGLKISCVDDEPKNPLELIAAGSLCRTSVGRVAVFHDEDYPSYLFLPITKGNILQTYMSGRKFPS